MKDLISKNVQRKVLLNPGPATTSTRVKEAMIVEDICPREKEFGALFRRVGEKVKRVVNADNGHECILLGSSGTGAIESCLSSCVDADGGIIIVENGAYGRRMGDICEVLGIRTKLIRFDWDKAIDVDEVEAFLAAQAEKFRVLAFVHHETTSGILNPLSSLQEIAKRYDMVSLVDAMSSYAGVPIDMQRDSVDYLVSSSNKCIQGMAGMGIVIVRSAELEAIKNFPKRSFYFDLYKNFVSQKEQRQFLFTPPVQVLYALDTALDEFFEEGGVSARAMRYGQLYEVMLEGMRTLGFEPLLEESNHSKILTTFLEPADSRYRFDEMHDFLYERGFTIYPGKIGDQKTFRISNIGQLGVEDLQQFLIYVDDYLKEKGVTSF